MSRQTLHLPIDVSESKQKFRKRTGELMPNHRYGIPNSNGTMYWPVTTNSARFSGKYRETRDSHLYDGIPIGIGRVTRVGRNPIRPNDTEEYVQGLIDNLQDHELIVECYSTHYCHGTSCKSGATCFFDTFRRNDKTSESSCMGCGTVTKLVTYLSTNSRNDEGKVDREAANHGPADAPLGSSTSGQSKKNKPAHKTRCEKIDRTIKNELSQISDVTVMNHIIKRASCILWDLYNKIHPPISYEKDDNICNMPQGEAETAAACFYAAKIEYEKRMKTVTQITMPPGVNNTKVLKICELLIKHQCIAQNLGPALRNGQNHATNALRERSRIFQTLGPEKKIILSKKMPAGFEIEEIKPGVLKVIEVPRKGQAHKKGLRQGDFIIAFENNEISVTCTLGMFEECFQNSLAAGGREHTLIVRRRVTKAIKSNKMPKLGVRRNNTQSNKTTKRKRESGGANTKAKRTKKIIN